MKELLPSSFAFLDYPSFRGRLERLFSQATSIRLAALIVIFTLPLTGEVAGKEPEGAYKEETGLSYIASKRMGDAHEYRRSRCVLDWYYPKDQKGFATLIWFHGGGLTGGERVMPDLKNKGLSLVGVGYRLSPHASPEEILEDAATATAWILRKVASKGGDPNKVFISGHSAGGYLAAMVAMDPKWLKAQGSSNKQLAGIIPVSAQVTTHFHVKKVHGDTESEFRPIIDEYAPLYHVSRDLPPFCIIVGDRAIEYKNRVEENDLFAVSLRNVGHPRVEFHEKKGLDHGSVVDGSWNLIPDFIKRITDA